MNHFKSLSDSSTSESEEDGKRLQHHLPFGSGVQAKRKLSADDTEDENAGYSSLAFKQTRGEFKNPAKYVERDLSNSESETDDRTTSMSSSFQLSGSMPTKDNLSGNYGVGMKLMEKMGYKSGTGLGKFEQGRVDIVHASNQRGRRGLGLHIPGLDPSDTAIWDEGKDQIFIPEPIEWIPECQSMPLCIKMLREWMLEGEKKINLDDEIEFCDPDILKKVLTYKTVFDKLGGDEMRKARTRSNPFELIRSGIFLNRAAMKMANMDCAFDYMFTEPKTQDGLPAVLDNELLFFADVCAGPGGFSEYVLWRKKWESKGFGFTLKGPNDFKLEDFLAGPPETFEPYYGPLGDGNIYSAANVREFKKFVFANTDNRGVHFVMADGGFSVEGCENEQEILSKRLYLCQFWCALSILRIGGHFVCKLFDLFTPFSVGLVYLMYNAFEKVCIFKPNTSRPANSERYIICKWLKEDTKDICDYMHEINEALEKYSGTTCDRDVIEVVPLEILKGDEDFYNYIVNSNNLLGANQIIHLDKIRVFAQNTELQDHRQNDIRKKCLKLWQVPDQARAAPIKPEARTKFKQLLQGDSLNLLLVPATPLNETSIMKLKPVLEIHCVVTGETETQKATLFLGLGRSNIYSWNSKNDKWNKIDVTLELPADTLFYGELISELKGEGRAQRKITCIHIIDALFLGGQDVRKKHYTERMRLAGKLARAVSKRSKPDYTPVRVKKVYELRYIEQIFDNLSLRLIKNSQVPRLCYDLGDGRHVIPSGLLFFKTIREPWVMAYSKSRQRPYVFNIKNNTSSFELVDGANAEFITCFSNRILWSWEQGVCLTASDNEYDQSKRTLIHSHTIIAFMQKHLNRIMGIHQS